MSRYSDPKEFRALRLHCGLSQARAAKVLNTNRSYVAWHEQGHRDIGPQLLSLLPDAFRNAPADQPRKAREPMRARLLDLERAVARLPSVERRLDAIEARLTALEAAQRKPACDLL